MGVLVIDYENEKVDGDFARDVVCLGPESSRLCARVNFLISTSEDSLDPFIAGFGFV